MKTIEKVSKPSRREKRARKSPKLKLAYSDMPDTDFSYGDLDNTNLRGARLCGSEFNSTHIEKANFSKTDLYGATFVDCRGTPAKFTDANLECALFSYIDLRGVDFRNTRLDQTTFYHCKMDGANFTNARLIDMKFEGHHDLTKVNFGMVVLLAQAEVKGMEILVWSSVWGGLVIQCNGKVYSSFNGIRISFFFGRYSTELAHRSLINYLEAKWRDFERYVVSCS